MRRENFICKLFNYYNYNQSFNIYLTNYLLTSKFNFYFSNFWGFGVNFKTNFMKRKYLLKKITPLLRLFIAIFDENFSKEVVFVEKLIV
jgi:hypothetical protein